MYMYSKKMVTVKLESFSLNGIINLLEVTNYLHDESKLSIAICLKCVRVYST